jgi:hypothetical protein
MTARRTMAYLWASPTSLLGLGLAGLALATGGSAQRVQGVLEVSGGVLPWMLRHCTLLRGGAAAITLGHVVLGRSREELEWTRAHERVHVRQCERWGPFFVAAYVLGSLIALLRGRRPYHDNPFEREAFKEKC